MCGSGHQGWACVGVAIRGVACVRVVTRGVACVVVERDPQGLHEGCVALQEYSLH